MNDKEKQSMINMHRAFGDTMDLPTPYIDNFLQRGIVVLDMNDERQEIIYRCLEGYVGCLKEEKDVRRD